MLALLCNRQGMQVRQELASLAVSLQSMCHRNLDIHSTASLLMTTMMKTVMVVIQDLVILPMCHHTMIRQSLAILI